MQAILLLGTEIGEGLFNFLHLNHQVTIETPNYPKNYPNKAKCNWKIKVPAKEEVHIWCENFDVRKGDFLRVS